MKIKICLLLTAFMFLTVAASAQDSERSKAALSKLELGRKKKAALDGIASLSLSLGALRSDAIALITAATKSADSAVVPYLKVLASDDQARTVIGTTEFHAHISLAKLGDPFALPEILMEIKSSSYGQRRGAVAKLALIGTKEAFRNLFVLLEDSGPNETEPPLDEVIRPNSELVMRELGKLFSDAPKNPNGTVSFDPVAWKIWSEKHKALIE